MMASNANAFWPRFLANSLARAFAISLVIHLALFGGVKLGQRYGWWRTSHSVLAVLLMERKPKATFLEQTRKIPPQAQREPPLLFVDVSPAQAATEAPKDAKYYSALNSKAANPDPKIDAIVPKVDGTQTKIVKSTDTVKPTPQPLQPALAKPTHTANPIEEQPKPKPSQTPGDLALAKPADLLRKSDGQADSKEGQSAQQRPRTLQEARARQQNNSIAGQKMKQEGGVKRPSVEASFDVKATPFGAYDAAFIAAVQQRWYDLLDNSRYSHDRQGKVVLDFRLTQDGRITSVRETENDVGDLLGYLCQQAILDPAPYAAWPSDMRRLVGSDSREVRFTFYYN